MENAVKYTLPGGYVRIEVGNRPSFTTKRCGLRYRNTWEEQALIFERFYALDKARSGVDTADRWGAGLAFQSQCGSPTPMADR